MVNVKKYFAQKEYRQLAENFLSLSALNGLNFLLPLITLPYLVRVLGPEKYGLTVFAITIINYFSLLINYGFNFSATKQISVNRDDLEKVSRIFSTILFIRFLFVIVCVAVLFLLLEFSPQLRDEKLLYILSFGIVIGNVLIPVWLFQGMEKMKFITIVNAIPKIIFTFLIFIFIKKQSDYVFVNMLNSLGFIAGGIFSFVFVFRIFHVRMVMPSLKDITEQLKEGWYVFVSTVFMNAYRESNTFILGVQTNYSVVAYYSAAEKVVKAIQSLIYPVSEALFPFMSKKFSLNSLKENKAVLFKISKYYISVLSVVSLVVLLCANIIVHNFLGDQYTASILNLQILSFVILIGGMNYLLGIIGLINLGLSKQFSISVFVAGCVSVITCFIASATLFDKGASWAMLLSETTLLIMILFFLTNKKQ